MKIKNMKIRNINPENKIEVDPEMERTGLTSSNIQAAFKKFTKENPEYKDLTVGNLIGSGGYALVYELKGSTYPLCVKVVSSYSKSSFISCRTLQKRILREITIMNYLTKYNAEQSKANAKKLPVVELICASEYSLDEPDAYIYLIIMKKYSSTVSDYYTDENSVEKAVTEKDLRQLAKDTLEALEFLHRTIDIKDFIDENKVPGITYPPTFLYDIGYNENSAKRKRIIIHRDIKASNSFVDDSFVEITGDRQFILGDFGIATFMNDKNVNTIFAGTYEDSDIIINQNPAMKVYYMPYHDVWLVGKMLRDISGYENKSSGISKEFIEIIQKAFSTNAENRYQTIKDMLDALNNLNKEAAADPKVRKRIDCPLPENYAIKARIEIGNKNFERAMEFARKGFKTSDTCKRIYAWLLIKDNKNDIEESMKIMEAFIDCDNPWYKLLYSIAGLMGYNHNLLYSKQNLTKIKRCLYEAAEGGVDYAKVIYAAYAFRETFNDFSKSKAVKFLDEAIKNNNLRAIKLKSDLINMKNKGDSILNYIENRREIPIFLDYAKAMLEGYDEEKDKTIFIEMLI